MLGVLAAGGSHDGFALGNDYNVLVVENKRAGSVLKRVYGTFAGDLF